MVYAVHILACIVYNDIHNAWVPVCGTLCILYQDHKLDSVSLLLTTYLQSAVRDKSYRLRNREPFNTSTVKANNLLSFIE